MGALPVQWEPSLCNGSTSMGNGSSAWAMGAVSEQWEPSLCTGSTSMGNGNPSCAIPAWAMVALLMQWEPSLQALLPSPMCMCRCRDGTAPSRDAAGLDLAATAAQESLKLWHTPAMNLPASLWMVPRVMAGNHRLFFTQPVPLLTHANQHTQGVMSIFYLAGS